MYINTKYLQEKELELKDVLCLQLLKQNKNENQEDNLRLILDEEKLENYWLEGLIDTIKKTKKNQSHFSILRLTKKAEKLLEDIQVPEILEEDLTVFDWLKSIYKKLDKEIGNQRKTKMFIALFRVQSGISRNKLSLLCKTFIEDEKQIEYSKVLEYLFFKPTNLYSSKFDLHQSRLYQYYLNNKEDFDRKFEKL